MLPGWRWLAAVWHGDTKAIPRARPWARDWQRFLRTEGKETTAKPPGRGWDPGALTWVLLLWSMETPLFPGAGTDPQPRNCCFSICPRSGSQKDTSLSSLGIISIVFSRERNFCKAFVKTNVSGLSHSVQSTPNKDHFNLPSLHTNTTRTPSQLDRSIQSHQDFGVLTRISLPTPQCTQEAFFSPPKKSYDFFWGRHANHQHPLRPSEQQENCSSFHVGPQHLHL